MMSISRCTIVQTGVFLDGCLFSTVKRTSTVELEVFTIIIEQIVLVLGRTPMGSAQKPGKSSVGFSLRAKQRGRPFLSYFPAHTAALTVECLLRSLQLEKVNEKKKQKSLLLF